MQIAQYERWLAGDVDDVADLVVPDGMEDARLAASEEARMLMLAGGFDPDEEV